MDKHSLEKVGYALLTIVQVGVVKTAQFFVSCLYFCGVEFDGFINTTLRDRVLQRNCNSVYVTQCSSLLTGQYTSDDNSNCTMDITATVYPVTKSFASS